LLAFALAIALILVSGTAASAASPRQQAAAPNRDSTSLTSYALSFVGYRYAYAGDTPSTGFSCTGFVHWVFSHFGYNTPEDPYALYNAYPHVAAANMMPGDVLLFANTFHPGLSHAAIYLGGGLMVGADNFAVGVHVDSVWDSYWGPRFVTALRVASFGMPSQNVQSFTYKRPHAHTAAPKGRSVRAARTPARSGHGSLSRTVDSLRHGALVRNLSRRWGAIRIKSTSGLLNWVPAVLRSVALYVPTGPGAPSAALNSLRHGPLVRDLSRRWGSMHIKSASGLLSWAPAALRSVACHLSAVPRRVGRAARSKSC
jgi:hypothetical protein